MQELNFKPITINDRNDFEKCFDHCQPHISEYTFTNLFMWRKSKELHYSKCDEGIIFTSSNGENRHFLPPVGFFDCQKTLDYIMTYGIKNNIRNIRLLPEFQKKFIKHPSAKIHADRNNFDYLYKTESLSTLKGWRLDGKRGFIKKFKENYQYEYKKYETIYMKDCILLMENWMKYKENVNNSIQNEWTAFQEMIENFENLNVVGGLLLINNKVIAFSFGEKLNNTTFVIHFEKADIEYTGSYQMINQQFIQNEAAGKFLFVNREQDLGIEGIRKSKLSYAPVRMVKKYNISF